VRHGTSPLADIRRPRTGPVHTLSYATIIHVDQVIDYRAPSASAADWPERHNFCWRLGFPDDWRRAPHRRSVQDRLGPPKRDRSPHQGDGGRGPSPLDGEPSSRRGGLDRPHSGGAPPNGPRNNRHHGSGAQWVLKADLVGQRPLPHATPTKLFFVNKAIVQEPMPWELHQARQVSAACGGTGQNQKFWPPKDHPSSYQNSKPEPTNSFGMQDLRDALPDPMVLESTLPLPLAIIHRTAPTLQAVATLGGTVCYRAS
jgi:hypothetical protein